MAGDDARVGDADAAAARTATSSSPRCAVVSAIRYDYSVPRRDGQTSLPQNAGRSTVACCARIAWKTSLHHQVRPDTGLTNPKLGIWLFLASEVMLFGSLFSAYALLRTGAPIWPDQSAMLNVPLATLNTVILISSSVTMVMAWAASRTAADAARRVTGCTWG